NEYISNVYNTVNKYVTNVSNTFNEYITNVTKVYKEYITNNSYTTIKYITNVIGVLDPMGFLKDPLGYIQGAFNNFIDFWVHGLVGSLAEGLQTGFAGNPPAPEGPGASFKLGFDSVVNEEE
ncbi:unnamed protein product, partial [marine sediment metagenome]